MKEKPQPKQAILETKGPQSYDSLAQNLGIGVDVVKGIIDQLKEDGYTFVQGESEFLRSKNKTEGVLFDHSTLFDTQYKRFGVISDTHNASKKERVDALESMYDIFEREGVTEVYHAGDITEGWGVYKGQEFEVKYMGQDEQIDYTSKIYPHRKGITTHFITGNHDLRQYEKGGVDPGYPIARARTDMEYLGPMTALVRLGEGVDMELLHPAGGMAYALSYKAQRDINNRPTQNLPNILVHGHYHTSFYMRYRDIHFLQAPCFKDAGLFEKRLGLNPTIGGWLVDATVTSGRIQSFKPELFTF